MRKVVYLGLDTHAKHCVLAGMDTLGRLLFSKRLPASEGALISHIMAVKARRKALVFEESSLASWLAGALRAYVDELIVCDPRQNALISSNAHKDDYDTICAVCCGWVNSSPSTIRKRSTERSSRVQCSITWICGTSSAA